MHTPFEAELPNLTW